MAQYVVIIDRMEKDGTLTKLEAATGDAKVVAEALERRVDLLFIGEALDVTIERLGMGASS